MYVPPASPHWQEEYYTSTELHHQSECKCPQCCCCCSCLKYKNIQTWMNIGFLKNTRTSVCARERGDQRLDRRRSSNIIIVRMMHWKMREKRTRRPKKMLLSERWSDRRWSNATLTIKERKKKKVHLSRKENKMEFTRMMTIAGDCDGRLRVCAKRFEEYYISNGSSGLLLLLAIIYSWFLFQLFTQYLYSFCLHSNSRAWTHWKKCWVNI